MLAERRVPKHEYYAAILNDRARQTPVLVTSAQGGMNIEDVAKSNPEAIITTPIDFEKGLTHGEGVALAQKLGFKTQQAQRDAADTFVNLYKIFKEKDATQIEINPMAETEDGAVLWCASVRYGMRFITIKSVVQHGCQVRF
jgi:succinyl-CoA synthetase beta subunit